MHELWQATKRELNEVCHSHAAVVDDCQHRLAVSEADQQRVVEGFESELEMMRKEINLKNDKINEMKKEQTDNNRSIQQLQQQCQDTQHKLSQQLSSQTDMAMR